MVQASVPEWDYVSHNSVLCSSVSTSSCDAFWLGRSGAAYVLRIPRACSSSCRLCCTCKRSQSCSVNTQQHSKQVPQSPGGKGGGPNRDQDASAVPPSEAQQCHFSPAVKKECQVR